MNSVFLAQRGGQKQQISLLAVFEPLQNNICKQGVVPLGWGLVKPSINAGVTLRSHWAVESCAERKELTPKEMCRWENYLTFVLYPVLTGVLLL